MRKELKVTVPLHVYVPRKTKEDRRYLLNLNAYRNWQGHENNNIKKAFHEAIKDQLEKQQLSGKISVDFRLYKGSARRTDKSNFYSVLSKFLFDAMVTEGVISDDNDDIIFFETQLPTEIDRENPRAEFVFKEVVDLGERSLPIGYICTTRAGDILKVVDYAARSKYVLEFQDSHNFRVIRDVKEIKRGAIKNPYSPSVYGVGYTGVGRWNSGEKGGRQKKVYDKWVRMLDRCYSGIQSTYADCEVCDEWKNYQNFAEWIHKQEVSGWYDPEFVLDKDLIVKGNREYHPDKCCLIPNDLNVLLSVCKSNRGNYLIGVCREGKKFLAQKPESTGGRFIGYYDNELDAFVAYKEAKELAVKLAGEKLKDVISVSAYAATQVFTIDIAD